MNRLLTARLLDRSKACSEGGTRVAEEHVKGHVEEAGGEARVGLSGRGASWRAPATGNVGLPEDVVAATLRSVGHTSNCYTVVCDLE